MRSQKAKGLKALADYGYSPLSFFEIARGQDDLPQLWDLARLRIGYRPMFLRPCPPKPVHGYLESRVVENFDEFKAAVEECRRIDPKVEFMLSKWVDAKYNAVLTPGRLTVGPGHDGATSGHGATELPLREEIYFPQDMLILAGILEPEVPYVELVCGMNQEGFRLTQLRAGPKLPAGRDYVPEKMLCERLAYPDGEDLLAWAKRVENFAPGTVVYHPGGSLASHYGVHCVLHKVPYFVSRRPDVGEVLEPVGNTPPDYQAVLEGIRVSSATAENEYTGEGLSSVLFALHESPWLMTSKEGCFLIGVGLDLGARCAMAALMGERRHKGRRRATRDMIYHELWPCPQRYFKKLAHTERAFNAKGWPQGYGGAAWATCTEHTRFFVRAMRRFVRCPCEKTFAEALSGLNRVVTAAHNNGKFLNKFASAEEFEDAARGQLRYFLRVARGTAEWLERWDGTVLPMSAWEQGPPPSRQAVELQRRRRTYGGKQVQCKLRDEQLTAHFQVGSLNNYRVVNVPVAALPPGFVEWLAEQPTVRSLADTGSPYAVIEVNDRGRLVGPVGEFEIE